MRDLLPIVIMLESFGASLVYIIRDQPVAALYWLSGGLITLAVILMVKGRV